MFTDLWNEYVSWRVWVWQQNKYRAVMLCDKFFNNYLLTKDPAVKVKQEKYARDFNYCLVRQLRWESRYVK